MVSDLDFFGRWQNSNLLRGSRTEQEVESMSDPVADFLAVLTYTAGKNQSIDAAQQRRIATDHFAHRSAKEFRSE